MVTSGATNEKHSQSIVSLRHPCHLCRDYFLFTISMPLMEYYMLILKRKLNPLSQLAVKASFSMSCETGSKQPGSRWFSDKALTSGG